MSESAPIVTRTLHVGGRTRNYLLHVPPGLSPAMPAPVVLAFHGAGTNAQAMREFCGFDEAANQAGFVVVYPSGTGRRPDLLTWNAGNCCGYAHHYHVDDVQYVAALLDDLPHLVPVDRRRIFAVGMSNGAMMAYRLAAEMADRIAAIAAVAGPMALEPAAPARAISVLHFHGTDDQFAPFTGGIGLKSLYRASKFSVDYTIRAWVRLNGCPEVPQISHLPDAAGDGTSVTTSRFGPGRQGSEVIWHTIAGGGHTWPGRKPTFDYLGHWTQNIVANERIWEFFQRHSLGE